MGGSCSDPLSLAGWFYKEDTSGRTMEFIWIQAKATDREQTTMTMVTGAQSIRSFLLGVTLFSTALTAFRPTANQIAVWENANSAS